MRMRSVRPLTLVAILLALVLPATAMAATPNELDPSFGPGGIVGTGIGLDTTSAVSAQLQSDGKVVVFHRRTGASRAMLTRFNGDGSIDGSFGTAGSAPVGG